MAWPKITQNPPITIRTKERVSYGLERLIPVTTNANPIESNIVE